MREINVCGEKRAAEVVFEELPLEGSMIGF